MHFGSLLSFFFLYFINLTKGSFACGDWSDHATDVIQQLNVSLTSEATNDPGKTPSTNGLAYIMVNGKDYAPRTKGFNVAVFDHLSGRFLTSAAFDCAASQDKCNELGTFLSGLPQDTVVLIAIQESGLVSGRTLNTSVLQGLGIQNSASLGPNCSFTSIGYKGQKVADWKKEEHKNDTTGPAKSASLIPITCSYMPSASTTCSPFNVALQKYGGSCMNSSSGDCKYAIDGNSTAGWKSSSSGVINSYIQIGFHTSFTVNKLRIQQSATTGQQIQEILLEFSDCSHQKFTLAANNSEFEEFSFLSRPAKWIRFTIKKLYGSGGGVGIQEIEIYNEYCNQKTLCDAVRLLASNNQSSRYRLQKRKFSFTIDAQDKVSVLLTSGSLANSSRYEIIIGSTADNQFKLKRIKGGLTADLLVKNITEPLKENEMRSFWIEVETDRVVFGSGEKMYLFWRDGEPINVKYVFFSTATSTAIVHVCGRTDQCYKDATHYWPLDKSSFVKDMNKERMGKIHGPWTAERAPAKVGFSPLTLSMNSSTSWVDLGDFSESCMIIPSKCPHGFSVSFKASISGSGTGNLLSFGRVSIFYVDETMYFTLKDTYKVWEVKGTYNKNTWQTFSMGWSHENGLTAVIVGNEATVLYDSSGKTVKHSTVSHSSFTIGRPKYFQGAIRDVAIWELEISEKRMKSLHVCNDPDTCPVGWEYFDGSCYKVMPSNLSASTAREACLNETADLVKITSEEENAFVSTLTTDEAWIGLEKATDDGIFYWKDGMKVSYEKWKSGPFSGDCVVMEASGDWRKSSCSSNIPRCVCEQVPYDYLGCYKDSDKTPAFVFNPGGYKPSSMTPGLCMHECGIWFFKYAALKRGKLCLCSNSTSPAVDGASDMCFWPCIDSGNLKCGGESHISVYKSVTVWPLSLAMSLESSVYTFTAFNITMTPTLPPNQTVESYMINIGDGTTHYTTHSPATIVILHPGSYYVKGTAIVKHSKTGYRTTIYSSAMVTAVSNLTGLDISCQSCAPVNASASCSVKFQYGSDVDVSAQFGDGKGPASGSLPDAAVVTVGIPVGEAHSLITSYGLYLIAGMGVTSKGEAVALEMDVETGGSLEIMVYRPKCMDSAQRYCPSLKMCISNFTLCTDNATKTCNNDTTFSFSDGQCVALNMSCCQNQTLPYGNFDYERIHNYLVCTTSGPKRILINDESQRFPLEPGDVFGVRFMPSGPTAALKTSSSGSSLFYSSAIVNKTDTRSLRGNRLPFTEDSPQNLSVVPAIALVQSTKSESRLERVYEKVGHKIISLSVGNSIRRENVTKSIYLQESITGLQLILPEVFPSAESVNLTAVITQGTNVTFIWDFGDKSNETTLSRWVTNVFDSTGQRTVGVLAGNKIGLAAIWCHVVVQERIAGLKFKNDSLKAIQNGTTARIGWMLLSGSHVDFNFTITLPDGSIKPRNLTDVKVPGARFFGLYKSNLTIVGLYSIVITATNKVNNETITGNLSVQDAIQGVVVEHPRILKTNETFNFTVLRHQGDEMARYTLYIMDERVINSTDKVIPYAYTRAGRYKIVLIASNDVSSMVVNCTEVVVQDVIEGLKYMSSNHSVAVNASAEIDWMLTQGSELLISIDYGDGTQKIVNRSVSVGDIFVAISKHNYTEPGEYHVIINASNLVDSKTINTTVYVETPAKGPGLAIWRSMFPKAQERLCNEELYVPVNDSVTLNVTISNGTNLNAAIKFGDNSGDETSYFPREFPTLGWTTNHSYPVAGEYNITVTFSNRNPQNVSYTCRVIVQYPVGNVTVTSNSPKASSDAVVTLNVSFPGPGYEPSGPLTYNWQHGDGDNTSYSKNNRTILHSYPNQCGVYIVTVNVSNEISYGIGIVEVIIQDVIQGLEIFTNHTQYENQCSDFTLPNTTYPVEYDVSFEAFITNGTNVTYTWYFDSDAGVHYTSKTCLHKFEFAKNSTVRLVAQNNVSEVTRNVTLTLKKSILGVNLTNDGPTVQKQAVNFTFTVAQKGSESLFKIDKHGSGAFEELNCASNNENCTERFAVTYENAGSYPVKLKARNPVSCVDLKTITVLVGKGPCKLPVISVPGFESSKKNFTRSEKVIIKTVNKIECFNVSTEFRWKITARGDNDPTDSYQQLLDEELKKGKINTKLSELNFPALYFNCCRELEFLFTINMTWAEGFYSEKKIYIEIVRSPLVASISGGSTRTVGNDAEVKIDASHSYDPDEPRHKFDSAWFCNSSNGTLPIEIPFFEINNTLNANASCFGYAPRQLTDFNNDTKISLNASLATPNSTYTIRFIMAKRGRKSVYKDQIITLAPGDPPDISIECVRNCDGKLNPSEKFALQGKGKSKNNEKIYYQWSILCQASSCEKEKKLQDYSAVPDLTSDSLVIKPNYFEGNKSYQITLSGHVAGGTKGYSTFDVTVNEPPRNGKCTVSPKQGEPLAPVFNVNCNDFKDDETPLKYTFFYKKDKESELKQLSRTENSFLNNFVLPSGLEKNDFKLRLVVRIEDKLGAFVEHEVNDLVTVEKKDLLAEDIENKLDERMKLISAGGNLNEKLAFLSSVAQLVTDQKPEENNKVDIEGNKKVVDKIVSIALDGTEVKEDMSLADLAQLSETLSDATAVPEQNSNNVINKVSSFIEDDADKPILKQAKDAPSAMILDVTTKVFSLAVNVILADSKQPSNNTQKAVETVKTLAAAVLTTKIAGEEETTVKKGSLALGVERYKADEIGNKTIFLDGSEVTIPVNFTACRNQNGSVNRMSLVSNENLHSGAEGAGQVTDKIVSLSFTRSKVDGSVGVRGEECKVKDLEDGEEISVMLPRNDTSKDPPVQEGNLRPDQYSIHEFNITENTSAVTVQVAWNISVGVQLYIRKGKRPRPEEGLYDFNATFELEGPYRVHSTNLSLCELFLSNDAFNLSVAGQYFVMLRFIKNDSLPEEERDKMEPDGTVPYNFSMYTSMCMFFDEEKKVWSTDGLKVGPKTNLMATECITTHLTSFGSSFFVPPNKINFDELDVKKLLESPHALIFVCVILGLYLMCLILARRADKKDALKTGVSPLPDNDSRDTYCYEIHVHTGFIRGAGTSAEVSIVLTGGLGDSEPRVLKDPNRKNFKTGSVDPFLLTVPQSLGSLKHIRVWHNNGGNYPSWNLLRVMIQDLQTDQRWWFVCDNWLAVDEGDGKIERTLYPASKKELTKFNVLFTSEVRKNLTDGHIWFSVVARPPRSTFTRVQRLTCCLSILMTTLIANAMFYQVGENETPKNAIRIMGFSFSIRQVSIGIMSSIIVFPANLIIVTIFRKARPKESQYAVKPQHSEVDNVDIEAGDEKKKSPTKFSLPHWFVYVAYAITFIATCTSASFVILYGVEFGPEKSARWLSSITISFIQDVLFTQPIKVFIMATLFALLIKDPKKAEQESFTDVNALAKDEEWLQKNTKDLDPETQQTLKQLINDKPPDEARLEIARKLRMKEKQMESVIREIAWYVIFLLVLLTIAYGNRDLTTSKVTKYMKDTFEKSTYTGNNITYQKVHEISHYWTWVKTTFIPSLMPHVYYNKLTPYDNGFLADIPTAFLLGAVRLRQLRIKKDTCVFKRFFLYFIHECNDFYSVDEEDTGAYLPGWQAKPTTSNQSVLSNALTNPWMYQTGSQLKTYPYWGYKATYSAGGFVREMPRNESESLKIIQNLSDTNWLDRYTRAIFSEFAIYNANTNLFSVVTLLFEQLPTGSLTPYPSILTLRLYRYVGGEMYFVLTCEIVYLLFCVYFVINEIKQFVKKGKEHLKNPWSILEIFLTCLSLSAVGLYFARLAFTNSSVEAMNNSRGTSFVSFHYTAFLDEWLKCIIGSIVFLSFLKVFRLLRFNRRMSMLQQVLKRCFIQLLSFMTMFALAFLAYALLACLVFGQVMKGFGTFLDSCASLMDTLLGKFTLKEMFQANRIIGPIFFCGYTVSMVFILINMFVTIINDAFTDVRSDVEKQSNDYEIVDFMIHRLKKNIGKTIGHAIHPVYKEPKSELELKFDKIVDDADNVIHSMRNITFEDFRKTRWFQNENCSEKKKNLMRLLMEVDWDFYEDELCDSVPIFERFLNEHSEEELEAILQSYRQKRMVEDLVFDEINGQDSSSESDSGSDASSDDHVVTSDDDQSSNDENISETEPAAEGNRRLSSSTLCATPPSAELKLPGRAVRVSSPALLLTEVEAETVSELEHHAEDYKRKSSIADQGVPDNELLAILDDVRRDTQSRCATDAELDSILNGDALSPRRCDSNPETIFAGKKKKKRKKIRQLPEEGKMIKEAWVTVVVDPEEPEDARGNTTEERDSEENTKAKKKMGTKAASIVEEKQLKRIKKKSKENAAERMSAAENDERQPSEIGKKKKKKRKDGVDLAAEDIFEEETREVEGTKRKKKKVALQNSEVNKSDSKEKIESEGPKKKKKKRGEADKTKDDDNGENNKEEDVEKESREESLEVPIAGEEGPKVGEREKKKKKKMRALEENEDEKTKGGDEESQLKKKMAEFSEMFEERLDSSYTDQTELKKKKKKGKAKKKLVLEEEVIVLEEEDGLLKSGETKDGIEKEEQDRKMSLGKSSVERKESVC